MTVDELAASGPAVVTDLTTGQVNGPYLTVAEVATRMRVSKMTVYRLVHGGELPAARVGRSFRVPRRAVDEYLRGVYFDAG
jgi:excisionase family DNA binding protein